MAVQSTETNRISRDFQPSILSAMWRYRWLVLAITVVTVLIGLWRATDVPLLFSATSTLAVDPQGTTLADTDQGQTNLSLDRYVSDQLIVLRSRGVAERAVEIAEDRLGAAPGQLTADELVDQAEITALQDSNLIQIRFLAEDADEAMIGSNALALAYQEIRREEVQANAQAAIERVDTLLENVNSELSSIEDQIGQLRTGSTEGHPIMERLETQLAASLIRLVDLHEQLASTDSPSEEESIRSEVDDIFLQITIFETVRGLDEASPELEGLVRSQSALIDQRSQLSQRRDTLAVDAELLSSGVTSYLPADSVRPTGSTNLLRTLIVMVVFAALIGGALAYFLATRRRVFLHRTAPETVLGAPLLFDIPDFQDESLDSEVPALTDPATASAEAFRFALTALEGQMAAHRWHGSKIVVVASPDTGDGKTTVVANLGLAAALEGSRVLLVDGDLGGQHLTALLAEDGGDTRGLTNYVASTADFEDVLTERHLGNRSIHLLSGGSHPLTAVDALRAPRARELFDRARERFDLVFVDSPAFLQFAYTSVLARHADALIVVVPHGGEPAKLEEMVNRLSFFEKPVIGYLYNRAPMRSELGSRRGRSSAPPSSDESSLSVVTSSQARYIE